MKVAMDKIKKLPACNGRFGASGGVSRPTLECRTATSALVQTFVNPPPVAKPLGRCTQAGDREHQTMTGRYNELKCIFEQI